MSLKHLYSTLTTEIQVMLPAMISNPGQPTLECQLQIQSPTVTGTPGFQHIPTMGFAPGAHNPQTATPQKYRNTSATEPTPRGETSHPIPSMGHIPLVSGGDLSWFTSVNLNFVQLHERKFNEIPSISVCHSQKSFPSSHSYFNPFIFKGSLDITWMPSCSQVRSSAREEEHSILHNSVLDLSLGHHILPPCTGALMPANKEHSLKRNFRRNMSLPLTLEEEIRDEKVQ